VAIQTTGDETIVDLLEGDITVQVKGAPAGGQVLKPGERVVVRRAAAGAVPALNLGPIPPEALKADDEQTTIACNARRTVSFDTGTDQEIVAKPTIPQNLPANLTVSPDRLPGGTP
jgi:hypothetical protein